MAADLGLTLGTLQGVAPLLLLRADAGLGVGNGHVVRSLALGQAWSDAGGSVVLASSSLPSDMVRLAVAAGATTRDVEPGAAAFGRLVVDLSPEWVAIDGYELGVAYHRAARAAGARVVVIDDHATVGAYVADLIVDQNLGASRRAYPDAVRVMAGSPYALLRREFAVAATAERRPVPPKALHLLVSLGGAALDGLRARVLRAVELAGMTSTATVLGTGAPVEDMHALLASSDLALTAGGTIVWELCASGVPMLALPVAANQEPVVERLLTAGACVALAGDASAEEIADHLGQLAADPALRRTLRDRAATIVDGLGAGRVVAAMRGMGLDLRAASKDDAALLYSWVNDPEVRSASFSTAPVPWVEHVSWLDRQRSDPDSALSIASDDHGPIGQFRAERRGREATVGVSIGASRRGERWAAAVIDRCSQELLARRWADVLHAWIRPANTASTRSFVRAGYRRLAPGVVNGTSALHYALSRDEHR